MLFLVRVCVCAWPWFNKRLGKYRNVGCQMEWTLWPFWIIVNECLTSFCIAMEILSLLFDLATAVTVLIIPELTLKDLYFISRATAFALVFVVSLGFFFLWFHVPLSPHNHPVLFQIPIYCCSSFKYTFTNVGCNIVPYFQYSVVVCFTEELFGEKHVTVRESVPAVIAALIGFQVLDLKGKREKEKLTIRLPWS